MDCFEVILLSWFIVPLSMYYRTAVVLCCTAVVDERIVKEHFARERMGKDKG